MIQMPGKSYHGPLPALTEAENSLQHELRAHVEKLAGEIGERNLIWYKNLTTAAEYIEASLTKAGYAVHQHGYEVSGKMSYNLEVEIPGTDRPEEIVVIGAHYDSVTGSPGANDNATGVAAVLALAGRFSGQRMSRTLRFVAFVNEEPPFFQTSSMGSRVYAQASRQRGEKVVAMLSLETIGYYAEKDGSQRYPPPMSLFYPSTGNFIAFVGNVKSGPLVREVIGSFRRYAKFPSEGAAFPGFIPGVGWSDHWAFWKEGYPAVMVTDTAPFRYPAYHSHQDTPEKVKYDQMARVVGGLRKVIADLANPASGP